MTKNYDFKKIAMILTKHLILLSKQGDIWRVFALCWNFRASINERPLGHQDLSIYKYPIGALDFNIAKEQFEE